MNKYIIVLSLVVILAFVAFNPVGRVSANFNPNEQTVVDFGNSDANGAVLDNPDAAVLADPSFYWFTPQLQLEIKQLLNNNAPAFDPLSLYWPLN